MGAPDAPTVDRALPILSAGSQALIRATSEESLLQDICQIIVETGGYRFAWVGYAQHDRHKTVRPVAQAGYEAGYLQAIQVTWSKTKWGQGPIGTAIRSGEPTISRNMATDARMSPWRQAALARGYASSLVLPLLENGQVLGALTIYATEPDAFSPQEVKLFKALADNLSYGIAALRTERDRQHTESLLRQSEERYRSLATAISQVIWVADGQGKAMAALSGWQEVVGQPNEACQAQGWLEAIHPDDRERVWQTWSAAVATGKLYETEFRSQTHTGEYRIHHTRGVPIRNPDGSIREWVGISTDVTETRQAEAERQQAEAALRDSEARFRAIFEWAAIGITLVDPEGYLLDCNPAFQRMIGYSLEELRGQHFLDLTHPDDQATDSLLYAQLITGQHHSYQMEKRYIRRDGQAIWSKLTVSALRGEQGEIHFSFGMVEDVTQQKQTEACLREGEERYRRIVETAAEGIWMLDANHITSFVNRKTADMLGYSTADMMGKSILAFVDPDWQPNVQANLNRRRQGIAEQVDILYRRRDGSALWAIVSATPIFDTDGRYLGALGMLTDITQRKQAEAILQQQADRERVITSITQRIHQSLDLEEILNTTVAEVHQLLNADRVIFIRFEPDGTGIVAAESVTSACPSMLGARSPKSWLQALKQAYRQQGCQLLLDVNQATSLPPDGLHYLHEHQIRAFLSVPILQGEQFLGILSAHQCFGPRQWQPFEITLLEQLAPQVTIAVHQSELYQQVQQLNANLEQQVQERTVQLRQSLEFEAMLKRITDHVRDHLDENQILQTAVRELALGLDIHCCDTGIYNLEQGTSTITYEHVTALPSACGFKIEFRKLPEIYSQLLQGQYLHFCDLTGWNIRPLNNQITILACPIFDREGILGDIWLYGHPNRTFNEAEIRLVQQVANQCAIAMRQARLYQAAQTQVRELENLNQLKDDFLSTISHELRTPVSNMKMSIRMLEIALAKDETEATGSAPGSPVSPSASLLSPQTNPQSLTYSQKARRYLQILNNECEREISLINDLLDLQRLEAGVHRFCPEFVQVHLWLAQVIEPFRERAQSRQQDLQIEIQPDLPPLLTDRSSLERVLSELLNNACKYTPPGERIQVRVVLIEHPQPGTVQFQVMNTGVEIPEKERALIFNKFYRIPSTDRWKQGGTGLGLTLVKRLAEHLEGTIQVVSCADQTIFTLELPRLSIAEGVGKQ